MTDRLKTVYPPKTSFCGGIKIDRGILIPRKMMVLDYGVASNATNDAVSVFCSICFFSCEKSLCSFQYFKFKLSSNVTFQNFDVLGFAK